MDRFQAITTFVAVTEQKGFAPAARKLGLSTSAATRLVAALEERLGVRLLNRTTRAVSVTDAGERFLERAKRILADLSEAERVAEGENGEPSGRLSVSAPQIFGRLHMAPLICEFMRLNPRVQVEFTLSDHFVNLVEEGIDVALRIGNLPNSSDVSRKIGAVRRVLVAAPAYLDKQGRPQTPSDLSNHRTISCLALTSPTNWHFWNEKRPVDVTLSSHYVTNSIDAALWHARHEGGLALAFSYQVEDDIKSGALEILLAAYEPPPIPVQFVYPSSRLLSLKVRALIDFAVSTRNWDFTVLSPSSNPAMR